jgi:hypothetical protein
VIIKTKVASSISRDRAPKHLPTKTENLKRKRKEGAFSKGKKRSHSSKAHLHSNTPTFFAQKYPLEGLSNSEQRTTASSSPCSSLLLILLRGCTLVQFMQEGCELRDPPKG